MKLWKWYVLDRRQFKANFLLSFVLMSFIGIMVQIFFRALHLHDDPTIFRGIIAALIFVAFILIVIRISPAIVTKFIKPLPP